MRRYFVLKIMSSLYSPIILVSSVETMQLVHPRRRRLGQVPVGVELIQKVLE